LTGRVRPILHPPPPVQWIAPEKPLRIGAFLLAPLVASDYLIKMLARPATSRLVYRRQISGSGSQGACCRAFAGPNLKASIIGEAVSLWASAVKNVSKFEIELLSKNGASVIGVANDAESALSVMDEAMRQYPTGHIRIRRGTTIFAERMPPRTPR
jgi:hypothetical protein